MDIDLPLVLFVLLLITGSIWLFDILVLKKKRMQTAEGVSGEGVSGDNKEANGHPDLDQPPVVVEYAASFFPVILLVFVIRSFLFEPFQIPSPSMVPTLEVGDFLLVNKFAYGVRLPIIGTKVISVGDPKPGDVMVFVPPHDDRYFIKRVIAGPGDYVRLRNNQLWVNNEPYEQDYVERIQEGIASSENHYIEKIGDVEHSIYTRMPPARFGRNLETVVPEGHYFMMGDNRDHSSDSRDWGPVPEENIVGKAVYIWMHWKDWGIPSFSRAGAIE